LADRAIALLEAAIANGYSDYSHMQEDADLDPIRELPAFAALMKAGHIERSYSAVRSGDVRVEAISVVGLDLAAHLERCRNLAAQGFRMVSLSAARVLPGETPVTASVWHRPVISEQAKDNLAERQARAAVALVRLGRAERVWPLLRHSPDPRLRSFIVNWLKPLGPNAGAIAAEFVGRRSVGRGSPDPALLADRRSPDATRAPSDSVRPSVPPVARSGDLATTKGAAQPNSPRPAERGEGGRWPGEGSSSPSQQMETILFDPETSVRRALILGLGTYGPDALSPGERQELTAKLLDLFKNDPDAGIHAAAEWALRHWNEQATLQAAEATLPDFKARGDRRWFANSQGETFVLIEGPVEFAMGSPATEPDRDSDEVAHRRRIPRKFAIANKEVSIRHYQEFARDNPNFGVPRDYLNKWSPDPDGPIIAVSWFIAAAYCNWLSKHEGLPESEWCYLRNSKGEYGQGMTIPAGFLKRKGYRLPTEAEWEYACRAGAITSRYYGLSVDLLASYARYAGNSSEHAWARGSLLSNDLGLFDMLGNEYEWCNEQNHRYAVGGRNATLDDTNRVSYVDVISRLLRGGAFDYLPAYARSASRGRNGPTNRNTNVGLRLARTYD
jgi:formylglycine-generating enzyme required for sulfatase activity